MAAGILSQVRPLAARRRVKLTSYDQNFIVIPPRGPEYVRHEYFRTYMIASSSCLFCDRDIAPLEVSRNVR